MFHCSWFKDDGDVSKVNCSSMDTDGNSSLNGSPNPVVISETSATKNTEVSVRGWKCL